VRVCVDIDECSRGSVDVCKSGQCINTPGSLELRTLIGSHVRVCVDIDECPRGSVDVCKSGQCINTPGSLEH